MSTPNVGSDRPIVLNDHYRLRKLAHFYRERVPEQVGHAKDINTDRASTCSPTPRPRPGWPRTPLPLLGLV